VSATETPEIPDRAVCVRCRQRRRHVTRKKHFRMCKVCLSPIFRAASLKAARTIRLRREPRSGAS